MISDPSKVSDIVDYFGFNSIDDATLNLSDVLLHWRQERESNEPKIKPKYPRTPMEVVDEVHERIGSDEYRQPRVNCMYFARLLSEIGEHFGHSCQPVYCFPDYLNGSHHWVTHDKTEGKYKDASIYRTVKPGGVRIPIEESGIDRTDIPEDILHLSEADYNI